MKKQLGELENSLALCAREIAARNLPPAAPAAPVTGNLYPVIEPVAVVAKPLPTVPAPDGVVDDIGNVIQTIATVVKQMMDIFGNVKPTPAPKAESAPAPVFAPAPVVAPAASPVFSRTLPGMDIPVPKKEKEKREKEAKHRERKEKKEAEKKAKDEKKVAAAPVAVVVVAPKEDKSTEPLPAPIQAELPKIEGPTPAMIKDAHDALDVAITKGIHFENPVELVVTNDDELYCVQKFRKMMQGKQEEVAKNFHKRYDKLCSQS
jgi:hypothetical protein